MPSAARLLLPLLLLATQATAASNTLYCCTDAGGRSVCGDPLPPSCYGRAYREINERGVTVRSVAAPLTPEQLRLKQEEDKRRAEVEAAAAEQKRKDLALLNTYVSLQDIDQLRERAEADVRTAIAEAEQKLEVANNERTRLRNEAEFYLKKGIPPDLQRALKNNEVEIAAQQGLIDAKKQDLSKLRQRYDADKRNYLEARQRNPNYR